MTALPANLCLFCVESTEFTQHFGKPIRKTIERTAHRVVGQSTAEHFQDVLRSEYGVDDSAEAEANGSSHHFGLWHQMPRM
jgi:hypothetical protein